LYAWTARTTPGSGRSAEESGSRRTAANTTPKVTARPSCCGSTLSPPPCIAVSLVTRPGLGAPERCFFCSSRLFRTAPHERYENAADKGGSAPHGDWWRDRSSVRCTQFVRHTPHAGYELFMPLWTRCRTTGFRTCCPTAATANTGTRMRRRRLRLCARVLASKGSSAWTGVASVRRPLGLTALAHVVVVHRMQYVSLAPQLAQEQDLRRWPRNHRRQPAIVPTPRRASVRRICNVVFLGNVGISPSCMRLYCTVWSSRLGSNDFGDIGTQVLAAALRSCTQLSRLSYESCAPGVSIRRIVTIVGSYANPCYVVRLACPGTGLATPACRRS